MDNNDKNNLDDSNDTLEENSFLNENIDDFIIRDDDKQYKTNEPLYTEITSETYEGSNQYSYSEDTAADKKRKDNTAHDLAAASLVLGVISVVFSLLCCCGIFSWIISIICGIIGIILGVMAKDSQGKREGMTIAGIICSIAGIVISILVIILVVVIYANSLKDFIEI